LSLLANNVNKMSTTHVVILDINGKNNPLYDAWTKALPYSSVLVDDYNTDWKPPPGCALLVSAQHYHEPEYSILKAAVEAGIPTLVIADGILEYRNTWDNPEIAAGCMFQPVVAHKIACLGRSQARFMESWGNLGKCEIVGAPRFDYSIGKIRRSRQQNNPFRLLVMTAKKLGFTPEQAALTNRSIRDLHFWLSANRQIRGTEVEVLWRLTEGLDKELKVENHLTSLQGSELASLLDTVDAVITTPSTSMLEAMFYRLPVALLDYHNNPLFVPAAWHITAPRHFDQVLAELFDPPAAKLLYQETIFHDALECRSPSTSRMIRLVTEMIDTANSSTRTGQPLKFRHRILEDPQNNHHMPEETFDMSKLYPRHPVFAELDRVKLQVQVNQLEREVNRLRKQLSLRHVIRKSLQHFPGPKKLGRFWSRLRTLHS